MEDKTDFAKIIQEIDDEIKVTQNNLRSEKEWWECYDELTDIYINKKTFFGFVRVTQMSNYVNNCIRKHHHAVRVEELKTKLKKLENLREEKIKAALQPAK